jgi:hypothetical protein
MQLACTIEYLDEADVFGTVDGALLLTDSKPAKGTIYAMIATEISPDGKPEPIDQLANAEVTEKPDGTFQINADSMRAEGTFGEGQSKVRLKVTPR